MKSEIKPPEHHERSQQGLSQVDEDDSSIPFVKMRPYWNSYFTTTPPEELNVFFDIYSSLFPYKRSYLPSNVPYSSLTLRNCFKYWTMIDSTTRLPSGMMCTRRFLPSIKMMTLLKRFLRSFPHFSMMQQPLFRL